MKNDRELIERLNRNKSRKIKIIDNRGKKEANEHGLYNCPKTINFEKNSKECASVKEDKEIIDKIDNSSISEEKLINRLNKKFDTKKEYYTTPSVDKPIKDWHETSTDYIKPIKKDNSFFSTMSDIVENGIDSKKSVDDILSEIKYKYSKNISQRKEEENQKAKELWNMIYSMIPSLKESMDWVNKNKEVTYYDLKRVYDFYIDFWRLLFENIK